MGAQRQSAEQRLAAARAAAAVSTELTAELREAEASAAAAQTTAEASALAVAERQRLAGDVVDRGRAVADLDAEAAQAGDDESIARDVADIAAAAAEQSGAALLEAQTRIEAARATFDGVSDREEANRLASRLAKVDATHREIGVVEEALAASTVTDAVLRDIEVAATAVESASGQAALASAHIEFTASADIELRVQDRRIPLSAGQMFAVATTEATDIEVAGVLRARIMPGGPASVRPARLEAARAHLAELLAAAGVSDVADARARADARRELCCDKDRLAATLTGLCSDEPVHRLRSRLSTLRDREVLTEEPRIDMTAARAALDAATEAHRGAVTASQRDRDVAAAAASALAEKCTRAAVVRERLVTARTQLDAVYQQLAQQRARFSDDDLSLRAQTHALASKRTSARVADLRLRLADLAPQRIAAELSDAERQTGELTRDHGAIAGELRDLATQLRVYGTEGRQGRLDAAHAEHEYALSEWRRVGRRARAARLLRAVVLRHRDDTRLRYVAPYRAEIQRLGRIVFGDSFEVDIDSSLRICSRTLDGRTVPYEALSGGAKEQLGIVTRLAGAALVAEDDSVPVIIDDALGFTDSHRLAKMGAAFDAVSTNAQVLVLTCSPRRYDSVVGAHHIELTPSRAQNI
ncbi:MAG: hypothetical protein JO280_02660 [Mycobacteriaceae bacterium]|nr:hypothetical protein [Mycobacteriaceae bacterium]